MLWEREVSINVFLVQGSTPLLVARSCFEEWRVIDYRDGKAMLKDRPELSWQSMKRSGKSHFVLGKKDVMAADSEDASNCSSTSTVGAEGNDAPEDLKIRLEKDEDAIYILTNEKHADEPTVELDTAEHTCVENQVETWLNDAHAALDEKVPNRKLIWVVFVDEGRLSVHLASYYGLTVETFSWQTGWDFMQASHNVPFALSINHNCVTDGSNIRKREPSLRLE